MHEGANMPLISVKVIIKWSWISWVSCWEALRVSVFLPFRNQQKISKIVVFWLRFTKRSKSFKEKRHPKILIFFHLLISWLCGTLQVFAVKRQWKCIGKPAFWVKVQFFDCNSFTSASLYQLWTKTVIIAGISMLLPMQKINTNIAGKSCTFYI